MGSVQPTPWLAQQAVSEVSFPRGKFFKSISSTGFNIQGSFQLRGGCFLVCKKSQLQIIHLKSTRGGKQRYDIPRIKLTARFQIKVVLKCTCFWKTWGCGVVVVVYIPNIKCVLNINGSNSNSLSFVCCAWNNQQPIDKLQSYQQFGQSLPDKMNHIITIFLHQAYSKWTFLRT